MLQNSLGTQENIAAMNYIMLKRFVTAQHNTIKKEAHEWSKYGQRDSNSLYFCDPATGELTTEPKNVRLWAIYKMIDIVNVDILEFAKRNTEKGINQLRDIFADDVAGNPSDRDQFALCIVNNYYDLAIKAHGLNEEGPILKQQREQTNPMAAAFKAAFSKKSG
jgi:hypothetical protein